MRDIGAGQGLGYSARPFPTSVKVAGTIWVIAGVLILVRVFFDFAAAAMIPAEAIPGNPPENPGAAAGRSVGSNIIGILIGAVFVHAGLQTVRGTARDTMGNSIGSIIIGLLNGGVGLLMSLGTLAIMGKLPNATAVALLFALSAVTLLVGAGLLVAGVLGLVGRGDYKAWKAAQPQSA